jgi:hypothetical protein
MIKCKICNKLTNNKVYCSAECQHLGYKKPKIEKEERVCVYCKTIFSVRKTKNNKLCSRSCSDKYKKNLMKGNNNGSFISQEAKNKKSSLMKELWKNSSYINKVMSKRKEAAEKNGYPIGHSPESMEKRIKSLIESYYGVSYEEYKQTIFIEKSRYYCEVWRHTKQQPLHLLENYDKRGRIGLSDDAYHIDHIIPISYGFKHKINPSIIGNIRNLQMLPARENTEKGDKYEGENNQETVQESFSWIDNSTESW